MQRPARRGERSGADHGRLRVRRHVELLGQGDVPEVLDVAEAAPRAEEVQQEALREVVKISSILSAVIPLVSTCFLPEAMRPSCFLVNSAEVVAFVDAASEASTDSYSKTRTSS